MDSAASVAGSFGRYADPALVVMVSLAGGAKHGYAIVKDVEAMGGPTLRPGTLYAVLMRLESRGFVEPLEAQERRRPYRLTAAGRAALGSQLANVEEVARTGRRRLGASVA